MEHFIIIPLDEGEFEAVLSGVDLQNPRLSITVEAMHRPSLDSDEVDGLIKGPHNAIVTTQISVETSKFKVPRQNELTR
jgi:hypothetical protein